MEVEISVEDRLAGMEAEFAKHKDVMDGRINQLEAKVDGVHALLAAILEKLSGVSAQAQVPTA